MEKEKIIQELIKKKPKNEKELEKFKREFSKRFKLPFLSNFFIFSVYQEFLKKGKIKRMPFLEKILKKRPIRSLAGIVNVSVVTKPYFCPSKCIFCPTEENLPKSYLSKEPAVERAKAFNFDPFWQTKRRIEDLKLQGHLAQKIELRIIGGTFSVYPQNYKLWFLKECFRAASLKKGFPKPIEKDVQKLKKELIFYQKKNEKSFHKIVGISIETRPDFITEKEIKNLRILGVTLVEMGVQSVFDDILKKNETGLSAEKIKKATQLLKDAGFKVMYHLMPNLLGSDEKRDFECFQKVFFDENFKPDWIKIYPLLIVKNTKIFELYQKGEFLPYSCEKLISLLIKVKSIVPRWVRIARIQRDIPPEKIVGSCKILNLRQKIKERMEKMGIKCNCLRCRQADFFKGEKIMMFREDYFASQGKEIFLSLEDKKREKVFSFLRLRIPSQVFKKEKHFLPVLQDAALIREIQTYGIVAPLGKKQKFSPQHRGFGKRLIKEAEKIAKKEFLLKKLAVIAGVGAREYFRKLGFKLKETYMVKKL